MSSDGKKESNASKTKGQKRQYHNSSGHSGKSKWQPKRGGPGIILTCETGRDFKAKREGLEILNYYYKLTNGKKADTKEEEAK